MTGPVLVELTRGGQVESRHRGSVAVVDVEGHLVLALGDTDQAVLPRSAVKALQALPLVASGAAEAFALDDRALALACGSHLGEPGHVEQASAALEQIGAGVEDLACGAHWPAHAGAARELAANGAQPTALHNNCSGKHAGFLAVARHLGVGALPDLGLGVSLKVDDGAFRAAEVAVATVLQQFLDDVDLGRFVHPPITSWRGAVVGALRPGPALADLPS